MNKPDSQTTTPKAWASTRWIGHISYAPDPCGVLYRTKREANEAGWDRPTRVNVTIEKMVRTS